MAAYGIYLGAANSSIAMIDDTGQAVVLKNAIGEDTTPSVVYFESSDSVVVGRDAKAIAPIFPDLVAAMVTRQMGTDIHWEYHGESHTPESVSALILRELARFAAEDAGDQVHDVVITVPAYFGIAEREATRRAGLIAGLDVLDVLAEPVAAALHYQELNDTSATSHVLVYDLGGTFNTTVIRLSGADAEVICTDGDDRFGAADWDEKVADFLLARFMDENPGSAAADSEEFLQELSIVAEEIKKSLSFTQSRRHAMRFGSATCRAELTRAEFESLTSELLERTMEITGRTIGAARERGIDRIKDVLLVGDTTQMPVIAATLKERFGLEPRLHEPDLAVVKGAALFAMVKQVQLAMPAGASPSDAPQAARQVADQLGLSVKQVEELAAKRVATVVPRAFGIKVMDSSDRLARTDPGRVRVLHLLHANTPLPADSGPQTFRTVAANQREVRLEVWEQAGSIVSDDLAHNANIASVLLTDLPPRPAGTPFEVTFYMTETGLLKVHAQEGESGREIRFEIQIGGLTDEQVRAAGDAMAHYMVSERTVAGTRTALGWAEPARGENETTDFDVFLCHNVADKPAVRWTAEQLRERGILPWLDETELQPGRPWQEELEQQIGRIRAAAVFVGPSGFGPWQNQELMAFLREFVERRCPVIPVLLPGAAAPVLPRLLRGMTWVDLRAQDPAAIDRLVWGITGRKPELRG